MNAKCMGFVKLSRKLLDWQWYDDVNTKAVFLHLLLTANYFDKDWHGYHVGRGDTVTSLQSLCTELGLTESKVRTALKHLKKSGDITETTHSRFRIITVNNYDYYLSDDENTEYQPKSDNGEKTNTPQTDNREISGNPQADNKEISGNLQADNKEISGNSQADNGEITDISQASNEQITGTYQHLKKDKKENNVKKRESAPRDEPPALDEIAWYISQKGYHFSAERFYSYYSARGWKVNGEDIVSWRAIADNWAARNYEKNEVQEQTRSSFDVNSLDDLSMFDD